MSSNLGTSHPACGFGPSLWLWATEQRHKTGSRSIRKVGISGRGTSLVVSWAILTGSEQGARICSWHKWDTSPSWPYESQDLIEDLETVPEAHVRAGRRGLLVRRPASLFILLLWTRRLASVVKAVCHMPAILPGLLLEGLLGCCPEKDAAT